MLTVNKDKDKNKDKDRRKPNYRSSDWRKKTCSAAGHQKFEPKANVFEKFSTESEKYRQAEVRGCGQS